MKVEKLFRGNQRTREREKSKIGTRSKENDDGREEHAEFIC